LRQRVDLVVMLALRERQYLLPEFIDPRSVGRKVDGSGFDRCSLRSHAHDFVRVRIDANGVNIFAPQVLDETET
jgi:hypothetical protein